MYKIHVVLKVDKIKNSRELNGFNDKVVAWIVCNGMLIKLKPNLT